MTWDEIYERAIDTACGDPKLRAKDNARWGVRMFILDLFGHDIETDECPEDSVEDCCNALNIQFDEKGYIISMESRDFLSRWSCDGKCEFSTDADWRK